MDAKTQKSQTTAGKLNASTSKSLIADNNFWSRKTGGHIIYSFFILIWLLLSFYDGVQLLRIEELSLFLPTSLFFKEMMQNQAGFLSYISTFFTQFLYFPPLGAAIITSLWFLIYRLTKTIFCIPARWSILALIPIIALLSCNTQLGYWIYYLKFQGYIFAPTLGTLFVLISSWAFISIPSKLRWVYMPIVAFLFYPLFGVYALIAVLLSFILFIKLEKNKILFSLFALLALFSVIAAPYLWYSCYTGMSMDLIYFSGTPIYQWISVEDNWPMLAVWIPYLLLFFSFVALSIFYKKLPTKGSVDKKYKFFQLSIAVLILIFGFLFWYRDANFRVELKQNKAMWDEDWSEVFRLAKNEKGMPSRLMVLNRNLALLNLGRAGEEMFTLPDGSADIDAPIMVHLTHTGGIMLYYQYAKFNFAYRWCVENAVEFGWNAEYLKHSIRSLILSQDYVVAQRYVDILKKSLFHKSWALKYEKFIKNPPLITKEKEFIIPLQLHCYTDELDVDNSYIEPYLMSNFTLCYNPNNTPLYAEAALMFALIRKDKDTFLGSVSRYLAKNRTLRLPLHYQEALLLYSNIDKRVDISNIKIDKAVRQRFMSFLQKTQKYKGLSEVEMAQHFVDDYGDTYYYFYFFVRELRTN